MRDDAGSVTVAAGAGRQAVALATARAIKEAAATIASAVVSHGDCFVIDANGAAPAADRLLAYDARLAVVTAMLDAVAPSDSEPSRAPVADDAAAIARKAFVPVPAFDVAGALGRAGRGLSSAIGLFESDYQIGGTDATPAAGGDDSLLAAAVAAALLALRGTAREPVVAFAATFGVGRRPDALAGVERQLAALARRAAALEAEFAACGSSLAERAAAATDAEADVTRMRARCDRLANALAAASAFFAWLASNDGPGGTTILARVVGERGVELASAALDARATHRVVRLHVKTENAGGDYVTRRSPLAGLFSIPFSASGGATVSYALLNRDGDAIAADVVTVYGGLVRLDRLRDKLTGRPNRTLS